MESETETIDNLITVVGGAYFQPITDLVARLQTLRTEASRDEAHVSPHETAMLLQSVFWRSSLSNPFSCECGTSNIGNQPLAL